MIKTFFLAACMFVVVSTASAYEQQWRSSRNIFRGRNYYGNNGGMIQSTPNKFGGYNYSNRSNQSRTLYNTPNVLHRGYSGFYHYSR